LAPCVTLEMSRQPASETTWNLGFVPLNAFQLLIASVAVIGFPSDQTAFGLSLTSIFCGLLLTSLAEVM